MAFFLIEKKLKGLTKILIYIYQVSFFLNHKQSIDLSVRFLHPILACFAVFSVREFLLLCPYALSLRKRRSLGVTDFCSSGNLFCVQPMRRVKLLIRMFRKWSTAFWKSRTPSGGDSLAMLNVSIPMNR